MEYLQEMYLPHVQIHSMHLRCKIYKSNWGTMDIHSNYASDNLLLFLHTSSAYIHSALNYTRYTKTQYPCP